MSEYEAGPSNMNIVPVPKVKKTREKKSKTKDPKEPKETKTRKRTLKEEKQPAVQKPVEMDKNEGYPGLNIKLFPHQLQSVKDMEKRESVRRVSVVLNQTNDESEYYSPFGTPLTYTFESNTGVLSDIPGYGKSLSVVGLLCRDQMEWDMSRPYLYKKDFEVCNTFPMNHNMYSSVTVTYEVPRISASLLLCSPSVLSQWEEYFSYSNLKVISVTSTKAVESVVPNEWDVVMVVPSMYKKLYERFKTYVWKRFIYDDPTQCAVPNMSPIVAGFTWFISATNMRSSLGSFPYTSWLFKLFSSYKRWQYGAICVKNDDAFVKASFKIPDTIVHTHKCHVPKAVDAVEEFVSPEIAEMLAAGDISGAIEKIGGRNTNGNLMQVVLQKCMDEKNDMVKAYDEARLVPATDMHYRYYKNRAVELEGRIAEINRKIDCMKERFNDVLKESCSICTDELTKPVLMPCCQHIFCGGCALGWLQSHRNCPMCRSNVSLSKLVYVSDNDGCFAVNKEAEEPKTDVMSKPDMLIKLLTEITKDPNNRIILFSCHDKTFDIAKTLVDNAKIDYAEIKGATGTRKRKIEKYKKGDIKILFLNANYNGAGINLQNTTHMIMYHPMNNNDMYTQIIGRAMRIGRTDPLTVHILD